MRSRKRLVAEGLAVEDLNRALSAFYRERIDTPRKLQVAARVD